MDFKQLLENKPLLYGIIAAVIVVLAVSIIAGAVSSSKRGANGGVTQAPIESDIDLLTTDNLGKAIEIQALLTRVGIIAARKLDGTKSTIYLKKGDCDTNKKQCTVEQRDIALLAIVKSGLMDQNVGLEIFDKGDFTSTKEDKRIRLARAINGELSRLIRKIPPIENASVFISIPEQSMFTAMQKPITATVQVTIPATSDPNQEDKLDSMKVKAITNLLIGSVTGLVAENISITDTNGNVYSSIIDSSDEMLEKVQENDKYMQQKVAVQLDRLIGKGNYVATVSTFLRQSPIEKTSITYDPAKKTSITEQTFSEGLGDKTQDSNGGVNAVSVYLPNGIASGSADSSQNRSYARTAKETQYGVSKTQTNEYQKSGVVEDISIAVTLEKNALPPETTLDELKGLIASAASPKVNPENVMIAFSDSVDPYLAGDRPVNLPKPDESGNPWWLALVILVVGVGGGLKYISNKVKREQEQQKEEMELLREKAYDQDRQLRDVNLKAAELVEKQSQMAQGMIEQQQRTVVAPSGDFDNTIMDLKSDLDGIDDDEAGEKIKNWIERG